jgi:hypothetical protein
LSKIFSHVLHHLRGSQSALQLDSYSPVSFVLQMAESNI